MGTRKRLNNLTIGELLNVLHGTMVCIEDAEKQIGEFRQRAEEVIVILRNMTPREMKYGREQSHAGTTSSPRRTSTRKHSWYKKGIVRYGWMYDKSGKVVEDSEEQEVIGVVRKLYVVERRSVKEVINTLKRLDLRTRTGRLWTTSNLWRTVLKPYDLLKGKR